MERQKADSDFDLMTRADMEDVLERLQEKGFTRNEGVKFKEKGYSIKEGVGVMNLMVAGRQVQVGFIGDQDVDSLVANGDINLNCCAYSLADATVINTEILKEVLRGELRFCDPEKAISDPMKIVSALKQISRIPDLIVARETMEVISGGMVNVVRFFTEHPDRMHKLEPLFCNINSQEVVNLFEEYGGSELLSRIKLSKEKLEVSDRYDSIEVEHLDQGLRSKIESLVRKQYGERLDVQKIFNDKINSIVYELDRKGDLQAVCLIDENRIYTVAAIDSEHIVALVRNICQNNYSVWATASLSNRGIIRLATEAGLRPLNDPMVVEKILLSNYPEYRGKIEINFEGRYLVFTKKGSSDGPQVLLVS